MRSDEKLTVYARFASVLLLFLIWRELSAISHMPVNEIAAAHAPRSAAEATSDSAAAKPTAAAAAAAAVAAVRRPSETTPTKGRPPSPPAESSKKKWEEPVPDLSWTLVPDGQEELQPLPGEGVVEDELLRIVRQGNGVLFNAIHRDTTAQRASKNIMEAMRAIKQMTGALAGTSHEGEVMFALFTDKQPWSFMQDQELCRSLWPECQEFQEIKHLATHVFFYDDLPTPEVIERRERFQTWPQLWLKRIVATLHSPFAKTLVVDSDVYACSSFVSLYDKWLEDAEVAITLAPAPFGCSRNYNGAFRPGFPLRYSNFTERNLGMQVLHTGNPEVIKLVALFRDIYVRHVNDVKRVSIGNDQSSFREALFTMQKTVRHNIIPSDVACRHDLGCGDGCLVVHRHNHPEMSGKEYQAWKREQNALEKEKKAARNAAAAAAKAA